MNQNSIVNDGTCPNCGARLGRPTALLKGGAPGAICPNCRKVWRVPESVRTSQITLSLRLPAPLHAVLRLAADRHRRSLTQEIVVALESYAEEIPA